MLAPAAGTPVAGFGVVAVGGLAGLGGGGAGARCISPDDSALTHGIGPVLGQVAADEKSNEIPAVRDLLKGFASLASAVITIDAMHNTA